MPEYDNLPVTADGARSAWGLFGEDDNVGLLNFQTPERVAAAARLVRTGRMFPLNAPIDAFSPPIYAARGVPRHGVVHPRGTIVFDDVWDNFYPQASSQWDSLGHVGYDVDAFYNGATEDDVMSGRRCGIEHWAKRGIAGRAVLLDMVATLAEDGRPFEPGSSTAFSVEDLEMARARSKVEYQPGDVVLVHTGYAAWYLGLPAARRARQTGSAPGIASGEDMLRYLWDSHVAAIASDTFAVEVFPTTLGDPTRFLHRSLIGQFGMALGELWWTQDLAGDCAADGIYEMFLSSAPLHAPGGIGSPANALAIK